MRLSIILFLFCGALVSWGVWIGEILPREQWEQRGVVPRDQYLILIDDQKNLWFEVKTRYLLEDKQHLGEQLNWSTDGDNLIFTKYWEGGSSIYVLSLRTGQINELISEKGKIYNAMWSPDGAMVAYVLDNSNASHRLKVLRVSDGYVYPVIDFQHGITFRWSPDSKKIALITALSSIFSNSRLYVINTEATDLLFTSTDDQHPIDSSLEWSPDSQQIVITRYTSPQYLELLDYRTHLEIIHIGKATERPLVDANWLGTQFGGVWSPDGNEIAFAYWNNDTSGMYLLNTNTSKITKIIDGLAGHHSWSKDGKELIFTHMETEFTGSVYAFNLEQNALRRLRDYRGGTFRPN
jgi:Tol biopolymer transport system component